MRLYIKFIFLLSIIFFASCSSKNQSGSSINCVLQPDSCSTVLPSNKKALRIQILGPTPLVIPVSQTQLKLVGFCNEGNYPDNYIRWNIVLGDEIRLNSEDSLDNAQCINGKFNLNINISTITRETQSNTNDSSLTSYQIKLDIVGFDYNANTATSIESIYGLGFKKQPL